jgi:hypothetical protein
MEFNINTFLKKLNIDKKYFVKVSVIDIDKNKYIYIINLTHETNDYTSFYTKADITIDLYKKDAVRLEICANKVNDINSFINIDNTYNELNIIKVSQICKIMGIIDIIKEDEKYYKRLKNKIIKYLKYV